MNIYAQKILRANQADHLINSILSMEPLSAGGPSNALIIFCFWLHQPINITTFFGHLLDEKAKNLKIDHPQTQLRLLIRVIFIGWLKADLGQAE